MFEKMINRNALMTDLLWMQERCDVASSLSDDWATTERHEGQILAFQTVAKMLIGRPVSRIHADSLVKEIEDRLTGFYFSMNHVDKVPTDNEIERIKGQMSAYYSLITIIKMASDDKIELGTQKIRHFVAGFPAQGVEGK